MFRYSVQVKSSCCEKIPNLWRWCLLGYYYRQSQRCGKQVSCCWCCGLGWHSGICVLSGIVEILTALGNSLNINFELTCVQKVLKEKEEHIEQLLQERDQERSEVARAAVQIDEVRL